jgi:hypothetical protein
MAVVVYQINSFGRSRRQCDWLADRVRDVMLDRDGAYLHPILVPGWSVNYRDQQTIDSAKNEGRDETGQETWARRERYDVSIVPG